MEVLSTPVKLLWWDDGRWKRPVKSSHLSDQIKQTSLRIERICSHLTWCHHLLYNHQLSSHLQTHTNTRESWRPILEAHPSFIFWDSRFNSHSTLKEIRDLWAIFFLLLFNPLLLLYHKSTSDVQKTDLLPNSASHSFASPPLSQSTSATVAVAALKAPM